MTSNWQFLALDQVAEITSGLWTGKKGDLVEAHVLRNANFTKESTLDFSEVASIQVEVRQLESRRLKSGDLILEKSGGGPKQAVGRVVEFNLDAENYSFSNFTARIRVKDESRLDPRFLQKYLWHFHMSGGTLPLQSNSTGIRNLSMPEYKKISIPLPPLDEQKRIVAKLDEALGDLDRLTENSKRTLDQIDALWVASIDEVMNEISSGTQMSTIGDIFKTSSGGTPLKSRKDYYEGGSVPWLLSGEVANSEITSAKNFITELALKETSAKLAPSNSVLVAMYGATAGEVGILRFEASTNQAVCAIHPIEGWNTEFIYYWMVYSKNHLISMAAGNAQPNVSQIKIRSLPIPLLDQRSQDNVVSRLSEIKKSQEETYLLKRQSMSEQNLLRGSILSAAFAGDF